MHRGQGSSSLTTRTRDSEQVTLGQKRQCLRLYSQHSVVEKHAFFPLKGTQGPLDRQCMCVGRKGTHTCVQTHTHAQVGARSDAATLLSQDCAYENSTWVLTLKHQAALAFRVRQDPQGPQNKLLDLRAASKITSLSASLFPWVTLHSSVDGILKRLLKKEKKEQPITPQPGGVFLPLWTAAFVNDIQVNRLALIFPQQFYLNAVYMRPVRCLAIKAAILKSTFHSIVIIRAKNILFFFLYPIWLCGSNCFSISFNLIFWIIAEGRMQRYRRLILKTTI